MADLTEDIDWATGKAAAIIACAYDGCEVDPCSAREQIAEALRNARRTGYREGVLAAQGRGLVAAEVG